MVSKIKLNRQEVAAYRTRSIEPQTNRALAASAQFQGDVLLVESENDDVVPHPVLENYRAAFLQTRSMTYRVISGADHALTRPEWKEDYTTMLVHWVQEMVNGARKKARPVAATPSQGDLQP